MLRKDGDGEVRMVKRSEDNDREDDSGVENYNLQDFRGVTYRSNQGQSL